MDKVVAFDTVSGLYLLLGLFKMISSLICVAVTLTYKKEELD